MRVTVVVPPRCQVIFGIGINQLSEWCEERVPEALLEGKASRNFAGSMAAGVACGYLSHIPHNLSALKLLQPDKSYAQHFNQLVEDSAARVPSGLGLPRSGRWALAISHARATFSTSAPAPEVPVE